MNKLLRYALILIGTAALMGAFIFGTNWHSFQTVFSNSPDLREGREWVHKTFSLAGMVDFIREQPQYVSLVSIPLSHKDSALYLNANTSRPMGHLSSLLLVTSYALQVEQQTIKPTDRISIAEWEAHLIPNVYESHHTNALKWLKKEHKLENNTFTIEDLVRIVIRFHDFAAHDALLARLGRDSITVLLENKALDQLEAPVPYAGMALSWHPQLWNATPSERLNELSKLPRESLMESYVKLEQQWLHDADFKAERYHHFAKDALGMLFSEERNMYGLMPQGTAEQLAQLLLAIYERNGFSESTSAYILNLLSWPMENRPIAAQFVQYGGLYESRIALQSGIDFGTSGKSGQTYIQVMQFSDLPIGFWLHMSSNFINLDYQRRLMWDPELVQRTRQAITSSPVHNTP